MANYEALLEAVTKLMAEKSPAVIAIDGPCGGGKTTLANRLRNDFAGSAIIRADDFFLQPYQRTPERLAQPGGNMDRERLRDEVLQKIRAGKAFEYRRYNCQSGQFSPVPLPASRLYIVEGSYSLHPELRKYYDLTVFLDIDAETRLARLRQRVPGERMPDFINRWIPMEEAYFTHFDVRRHSGLVLCASDSPTKR